MLQCLIGCYIFVVIWYFLVWAIQFTMIIIEDNYNIISLLSSVLALLGLILLTIVMALFYKIQRSMGKQWIDIELLKITNDSFNRDVIEIV